MGAEDPIARKIEAFLLDIGIPLRRGTVACDSVLPGIDVEHGGLVVDPERLRHPGDLLHEAGHLAVASPETRKSMHGNVGSDGAEEMMAIAWSYAAALHIGIDPAIVFHDDGYRGAAAALLENLNAGRYIALPMLQWTGMAFDAKCAKEAGEAPYPAMRRWIRSS